MPFRYPVALELEGRRCVVIGGGQIADQKARALLEGGADVVLISEAFSAGLEDLGSRGKVKLVRKPYSYGDLEGAFVAIAAMEDRSRNDEIFKEAEERNVLLNAVDDIPHCHFAAPSIIRQGDFMMTISTGGKAPALAKRLRKELSEQFGPEYGRLVELLGRVREKMLPQRKVDFDTWAGRWAEALSQDLIGLVKEGRVDEAEARVAALIGDTAVQTSRAKPEPGVQQDPPDHRSRYADQPVQTGGEKQGKVFLVGAGPGDPGLITVAGHRALQEADIVVADRLVHPQLVSGKEVVYVGKEAGPGQVAQTEINALLVRLARAGQKVVRLKGGDPFVFGRGGEEMEALAGAGICFSVVPGPSSALAAVAAAGIPVTDRRFASSVAIVTGHSAASQPDGPAPDYRAIAGAADTIVILMGLSNLEEIVRLLIEGGKPPATPAAIIENGTLPSQRVIVGSLRNLSEAASISSVQPPSIIVVGEVVRLKGKIDLHRS